jgi:hypothetical protein
MWLQYGGPRRPPAWGDAAENPFGSNFGLSMKSEALRIGALYL